MKKTTLSLLAALVIAVPVVASEFDRPGYVTEVEEGRLWVFKAGSPELEQFKSHGEPAQQFTNIGAGPNGMTVKAANQQTLDDYLKAVKQQ